MNEFLLETKSINYNNPIIQEKVMELKKQSNDKIEYIKNSYYFVRDEIPHSWDINSRIVSRNASDVLKNRTGICWTKSCLLAALLRANNIPSGITYQLLTRADDTSEGYIIHALNTVYTDKWIRLDARGNKDGVNAQFSLEEEKLAYQIRNELGEIDYKHNYSDLDSRLVKILSESENVLEIYADFKL